MMCVSLCGVEKHYSAVKQIHSTQHLIVRTSTAHRADGEWCSPRVQRALPMHASRDSNSRSMRGRARRLHGYSRRLREPVPIKTRPS